MSHEEQHCAPLEAADDGDYPIDGSMTPINVNRLKFPDYFDQSPDAKKLEEITRQSAEPQIVQSIQRMPNWPSFCPLIHHDIEMEIPQHSQSLMRVLYFTWKLIVFGLLWNLITILVTTGTFYKSDDSNREILDKLFSAVLFVITAIPFSFLFWYRSLYKLCLFGLSGLKFEQPHARLFGLFVSSFALQMFFIFRMVIGAPWADNVPSGIVYLIVLFETGNGYTSVFAMALINTILWFNVMSLSLAAFRGFFVQIRRVSRGCVQEPPSVPMIF